MSEPDPTTEAIALGVFHEDREYVAVVRPARDRKDWSVTWRPEAEVEHRVLGRIDIRQLAVAAAMQRFPAHGGTIEIAFMGGGA